ncbi:MAG: hypothetical protein QXO16_04580 [Archaeoglobaceae archaeon]
MLIVENTHKGRDIRSATIGGSVGIAYETGQILSNMSRGNSRWETMRKL